MGGKLGGIAALALAGCVAVAPQATGIRVTKVAADVASCAVLGTVKAEPPYVGPHDAENQLRNLTAGLGADTLFITSMALTASGMAYRCEG